jgi:hypothetical protein
MAKLTFKRVARTTGLASISYNDEKRTCYIRVDGEEVGHIYNRAHSYVIRGEDVWRICLFSTVDGVRKNVILKARFDKLDDAKAFVRKNWKKISERWQIEEWL